MGEIPAPDRRRDGLMIVARHGGFGRLAILFMATLALLLWLQPATAFDPGAERPGRAAIASAHYLATEAGHEIIEAGGNAFDAAIAVSSVLAVVEQTSSGIGGGGFWLLHRASDGHQVMVDGREQAPAAAHMDMYLDENGEVDRDLATNGPLAAAIPGEIAALEHIAQKYGRLSLGRSLQPAIRVAREGFPVYEKFHTMLGWKRDVMKRWPAASEAFLLDGEVPPMGHVIRLPDLAALLEEVAAQGADAFYRGDIARRLVEGVREAGGIWTLEDLAAYEVKERDPIYTEYGDYQLVTASPPSSGGIAIATMLNILEAWPLAELDRAQRAHYIAEAMRRAFRDRALHLGDPDFYDVPVERLTSQFYADGLRAAIHPSRATPSDMLPGSEGPREGTDTTHFSVIDAEGNMVAATLTVNLAFGNSFMVPGTGFVLNNEMDDFSAKPGEPNAFGLIGFEANEIQPSKRPLSSMSPTFIMGEDKVGVLGTPGGSRIITMVLLGILDFMEGKDPESWVSLPRFHHQYVPDRISAEPDAFTAEEIAALEAMGHEVQVSQRRWGNMHGVLWNRETGEVSAGSDPRSDAGRAMVR